MVYLSLLTLAARSRQVRAELADPYQMHRTLSKAFGEESQLGARCLFRVEEGDGEGLSVLVQSRVRPDWGRLTVGVDYWSAPPRVKEFAPRLMAGQALAFRLRANPTVRRDGKRLGLYGEADQLSWLARKASENGFSVCSVTAQAGDRQRCQTRDRPAVFSGVQFEGVLRVSDPAVLLSALEGGIGAGKGFGFGLLSLALMK